MVSAHYPIFKRSVPTLALVVTGVVATLVLITMPVFVGGIVDQFGWGDKEVGWLASADMGGSAVASLIVARFVSRLNWRSTAWVAIFFVVLGNVISIHMDSVLSLFLIRVFTGFSNGLILSLVFVGLCHSSNPDRYFGIYVFSQLTLQACLLVILPDMLGLWGMVSVYLLFASASAATSLLVFLFPRRMPPSGTTVGNEPETKKSGISAISGLAIVALGAQAVYFLAPAAIWGYFESIGQTFTLTINEVGDALGTASLAGIFGALVVIVLGTRFNRLLCMGIGTTISIAAVWILLNGFGFAWFLAAAALFNFAWNYTFPYQMGVLALFDRSGSVAILSLVVQLFGLSFGPMLATFLLFGEGYSVILWACAACFLISYVMFYVSDQRRDSSEGY